MKSWCTEIRRVPGEFKKLSKKLAEFYGFDGCRSQLTGNEDIIVKVGAENQNETKTDDQTQTIIYVGTEKEAKTVRSQHGDKLVIAHIADLKRSTSLIMENHKFKRSFLPNEPPNLVLIERKFEHALNRGEAVLLPLSVLEPRKIAFVF